MKLRELRAKLADALSDSLGTFANGQLAIWAGEAEMPSGLANGVQCNIQPVPIANRDSHPVSGGMVYLDQSWRVTLVNFDRSKTMAPTIRKVQQLNPRNTAYLPLTAKTFEQYSFEIFDPGFVGREDLQALPVPASLPAVFSISPDFDTMALLTTIALSGHRLIALSATGDLEYADYQNINHANAVIGITTAAFAAGTQATVLVEGAISEPGWNWIPRKPLFLGSDGYMTQIPPESGILLSVGRALSPTKVFVEMGNPIIRS